MGAMFDFATSFNGDMSSWNVGKVTSMSSMLRGASSFDGDSTSSWDVSKVTAMRYMFYQAFAFNGDLSLWNITRVQDVESMLGQTRLDKNLCSWRFRLPIGANVRGLFAYTFGCPEDGTPILPDGPMCYDCKTVPFETTKELQEAVDEYDRHTNPRQFSNAAATYGFPMGSWDVSQITSFESVFDGRRNTKLELIDEDLSGWDVSAATKMSKMFRRTSASDYNISLWDVSQVTDMSEMFFDAEAFNADLSAWNVSRVTNMFYMFGFADDYNKSLCAWQLPLMLI